MNTTQMSPAHRRFISSALHDECRTAEVDDSQLKETTQIFISFGPKVPKVKKR
jgi:hypothetical protein